MALVLKCHKGIGPTVSGIALSLRRTFPCGNHLTG